MPDLAMCVAATLLFAANALLIVFYDRERQRGHWDREKFYALDADYIESEWEHRTNGNPLWLVSGFVNAFGWLFLCVPLVQLSWVLSRRGQTKPWLHIAIAVAALAGSLTEWISRLYWVGSNLATQLVVREFTDETWFLDRDGIGWKSLELTHIVTSGFVWFLDAFEWLCLSFVLILTYVSVRRWRQQEAVSFGGCWNSLGLFIGLMCLLEFTAEVLRFDGFRTFGPIAIVYAILNRLILMPIWLFSLAFMLPKAIRRSNVAAAVRSPVELELVEEVTTAPAPTTPAIEGPLSPPAAAFATAQSDSTDRFTIGDDEDEGAQRTDENGAAPSPAEPTSQQPPPQSTQAEHDVPSAGHELS